MLWKVVFLLFFTTFVSVLYNQLRTWMYYYFLEYIICFIIVYRSYRKETYLLIHECGNKKKDCRINWVTDQILIEDPIWQSSWVNKTFPIQTIFLLYLAAKQVDFLQQQKIHRPSTNCEILVRTLNAYLSGKIYK